MKRLFLYTGIISIISCGLASCEKEEIMTYDRERAAIEFGVLSTDYSFRISDKTIDTTSIPFYLVGVPVDRDRVANIEVVADKTTATSDAYDVISAIMPAGERVGYLKVRVANTQGVDFQESSVYFRMGSNENFIPGADEISRLEFNLTNKLIRPAEWDSWLEKFHWGTYSTAYYAFIIEVTGISRFPYDMAIPGINDDKPWTPAEKNIFLEKLRYELRERNKREGTPLLHDDGPAKGKEVVVGYYYQ